MSRSLDFICMRFEEKVRKEHLKDAFQRENELPISPIPSPDIRCIYTYTCLYTCTYIEKQVYMKSFNGVLQAKCFVNMGNEGTTRRHADGKKL